MLEHFNFWLVAMSLVILIASFYGRYEDLMCEGHSSLKSYLIVNLILVLLIVGAHKILYFFIIFELSIIPIFLVITGWGYQPEKIRAAYALFFFTAVSAGPLLIILITSYNQNLNLEVGSLYRYNTNSFYNSIQRFLLLGGFSKITFLGCSLVTTFSPCGSSCLRLYYPCRNLRDLLFNRVQNLIMSLGIRTL